MLSCSNEKTIAAWYVPIVWFRHMLDGNVVISAVANDGELPWVPFIHEGDGNTHVSVVVVGDVCYPPYFYCVAVKVPGVFFGVVLLGELDEWSLNISVEVVVPADVFEPDVFSSVLINAAACRVDFVAVGYVEFLVARSDAGAEMNDLVFEQGEEVGIGDGIQVAHHNEFLFVLHEERNVFPK